MKINPHPTLATTKPDLPVTQHVTPRPRTRRAGQRNSGRNGTMGTVLARVMRERGIKHFDVARVLVCSDRQVYNYMKRIYPVPTMQLGALCDRLDMDPEQLVDENRFLLMDTGRG